MMKLFQIFICACLLSGCSSTSIPTTDAGSAHDAESETSKKSVNDFEELTKGDYDNPPSPCGKSEMTEVVVDGKKYVFIVPLPCNPYYRDIGDPQPKN